jgi:long-chain acyl-CoA synthetase
MRYLKEVTPSQAPDESPIYRSNLCNEQLMYEIPNVTTCYELLLESVKLHNTKKAFGHREVVDIIEETKEIERKVDGAIKTEIKKWSYYQLADYDWWSFEELLEYVKKAGSGFRNLGLKEKDFVGIFAPTK